MNDDGVKTMVDAIQLLVGHTYKHMLVIYGKRSHKNAQKIKVVFSLMAQKTRIRNNAGLNAQPSS